MGEVTELAHRLDDTLKGVLLDAQGYASPHSLERKEPKRWMKLARMVMEGAPVPELKRECNNWHTIARIRAQVLESPACGDLKRELAIRQVEALETTRELRKTAADKLKAKMGDDAEWYKIDLEQAGRLYDRLTIAEDVDTKTLMRLRGDNVQRVEVTRKDFNFEDMLKELREMKAAEKDVIELKGE